MKMLIKMIILSLTFFSFSALADKVTLKFHTFVPAPANSNAKFVLPWAEKVKKESNGEIVTEMYYSMQLGGKPPQLVDQVREGVVDIVGQLQVIHQEDFQDLKLLNYHFCQQNR